MKTLLALLVSVSASSAFAKTLTQYSCAGRAELCVALAENEASLMVSELEEKGFIVPEINGRQFQILGKEEKLARGARRTVYYFKLQYFTENDMRPITNPVDGARCREFLANEDLLNSHL